MLIMLMIGMMALGMVVGFIVVGFSFGLLFFSTSLLGFQILMMLLSNLVAIMNIGAMVASSFYSAFLTSISLGSTTFPSSTFENIYRSIQNNSSIYYTSTTLLLAIRCRQKIRERRL